MEGVTTGKRLKAARTLTGVTVPQLAKALSLPGLSAGTLGAIERDERALRPQEVAPLADELGVPPAFFTDDPLFEAAGESQLDRIEAATAALNQKFNQLADNADNQRRDILNRLAALEEAILANGDRVANEAVDQVRDLVTQPDALALQEAMAELGSRLHVAAEAAESRRAAPRRTGSTAK